MLGVLHATIHLVHEKLLQQCRGPNRVNLAQPNGNTGSGASFASTATIGLQYGAPGIGSGEPHYTQPALKILF